MNEIISIIAEYAIVAPVLLVIVAFFRLEGRDAKMRFILLLILGGILALALSRICTALISNPRPFIADPNITPLIASSTDNGFPSDHALFSSFFGWAITTINPILGAITLGIALLIGAARVLAHVHHWWDVIGAFVMSGVSVLLVWAVIQAVFRRKTDREKDSDKNA